MPFPKVEIRPRRSMAFFAILSIVMVVASYLFVLLLAAACVYLPYLLLSNMESPGFQILALMVFGVIIALAMLWSLVPRPDKFHQVGLRLDPATQPRLFTELENIAAALNEPMPREVYLIGDVNAWVADRGGFLGFGSRRVMAIGLPLLSVMTVSQFRAVLAHEFAHYYGGDTSLGPWIYKTQTAMVRTFQNIGSLGRFARMAILSAMYLVVATLLKWYFVLFLRAIKLASRQSEHRADELACLIAGRQPLIEGLQASHGASLAWPSYWKTELAPVLGSGAVPGISEGFARFVSIPNIQEQIQKGIAKRIQEEKPNPYDSHPCLRDRIAATQKLSDGFMREDSQPARSLLDCPEATELRFLESMNPDLKAGSLKCISWDEVGTLVTIPSWKTFAAEYSSFLQGVTAATLPDQVPKLCEIGPSIRDPKGVLLDPEQRRRRAGQLFGAGLALALLEHGWILETGPGVFHLKRENATLNPFLVVDQLMTNKLSPQEWDRQCERLGIAQVQLHPAPEQQLDLPIPGSPVS